MDVKPVEHGDVAPVEAGCRRAGQGQQPAEVPVADLVDLAGVDETVPAEMADGVEQAVAHLAARLVVGLHERFGDQRHEQVEDLDFGDVAAGDHRLGGVEVERASEHREAPQRHLLASQEEIVAPLHRGLQCLLAGQGRAAASGQEPESVS